MLLIIQFLFVLLILLCKRHRSSYVVTDSGEVLVALNWHQPKKQSTLHFYFHLHQEDLDSHVWNFCELKIIGIHYCSRLFAYIQKLQRSLLGENQARGMIDVNYATDTDSNESHLRSLRNKNFVRHHGALAAEMNRWMRATVLREDNTQSAERLQRYRHQIQTIMQIERAVTEVIWSIILRNRRIYKEVEAISFIHSESYDQETESPRSMSKRELQIILDEMNTHGLMAELDGIFVLHYGSPVSKSLISLYPEVTFIHVSTDTSFGQIPSLHIMKSVAVLLSNVKDSIRIPPHILYMRTLGTDYLSIHPQIEDWRSMMLHFLVEKHTLCYELLETGDIDVLSLNYVYKPSQRSLHGNYWWTTAIYLTQLVDIPYYVEDVLTTTSQWLFTYPSVRMHILHNSYENHELSIYPRYCYANVLIEDIPSFQIYKQSCGRGATFEKYALLHNETALNTFPIYNKDLHNADSSREIASPCSTFELVTVFDS